ncbi:Uncharacterised protein [Chlamydia abortus]|uniref:hypothetical protein n=1 Tax=Paenibacillus sp. SAFN-117 TaxID=3436860 RepID=UPI000A27D41E|nr:Uncharacterised protein [Chlamydia abortus]
MLEIIESLIPANIDFTTALLIIVLCAFIDILSPGVLAITAYILLIQKEKGSSLYYMGKTTFERHNRAI